MVDVLIIGAGASGLNAARILSSTGKSVVVVEARDRIGGRIHTIQSPGFSIPLEDGAEFIHGELPLTMAIVKEAGIQLVKAEGKTYSIEHGKLETSGMFPDMDEVMEKLNGLDGDVTMGAFLRQYFSEDKYADVRESITRMAEGLDAADVDKVSALALRDEWSSEDEEKQFHPVGGYGQVLEFLFAEAQKKGAVFKFKTKVSEIHWSAGNVEAKTSDGKTFVARRVVITIPPSVVKKKALTFFPEIVDHRQAIEQVETGTVIKFLVEFKSALWEQEEFRKMPGLHFLFSDAFVPTWWTQKHLGIPLLTGWLSGPKAESLKLSDTQLLGKAYESLSYLLQCPIEVLRTHIRAARVINWLNDDFAMGAYAYKTPATGRIQKILNKPVDNTIYFAGEALYDGPEMGTVEAALASGKAVAET